VVRRHELRWLLWQILVLHLFHPKI